MTLPSLRRANCGHYVHGDTSPVGVENTAEVYLCAACLSQLAPRPETKVIEPELKVIDTTKRRPRKN